MSKNSPSKPLSTSPSNPSSLSEISHLFLTDLRQRQTAGGPRPARKPPVSIDLTPDEFAAASESAAPPPLAPRISLVLAHHLGQSALKGVREYASHVAAAESPLGLIELTHDALRVTCFDAAGEETTGAESPTETIDPRRIADSLAEMNWDIKRWLLFLPTAPRSAAAQSLITQIKDWTLLVASGDQGVIEAYRLIKGLATVGQASLSLAVLNAEDDTQADMIHRKLAGTIKQFLNLPVGTHVRVTAAPGVADTVALSCRATAPTQDHWLAVSEFTAKSAVSESAETPAQQADSVEREDRESIATATIPLHPPVNMRIAPAPPQPPDPQHAAGDEVLDLPTDADAECVLSTILARSTHWINCPLKAPMCPAASIAVDRAGTLNLLAVAAAGLTELSSISRAYAWLMENRPLVQMALPQLNIDSHATPRLTLFIDQSDATGQNLSPILQAPNVVLKTYRRLRWGQKAGLLLQAA